ncbi:MAG: type I secretion C-terminal target domain-containing protein, partial [Micavibrio sp.]|nr:type I secretion C-terminal target domain-containing protein [Micavibrio sp.]
GTDYDDAFIDVAGVSNILVGGAGYDTLNYNGWAQGISVNLSNQSADDGVGGIDTIKQFEHIIGTNYSDELKGSNDYNIIYGGNGRDIIRGYGSSDDLYGGEGNDGLYGGNGNDELYGEAGNDLLKGADGDDTLEGGAGNDLIEGGDQNDTLRGGDDNDVLYGGIHGDDLYGGAGTDHLHGDAGNDDLWGGAGADTFFLTVADDTFGSQDRVYDFSLVDGDMIDLSDLLSDIGYDPLSDTISDWVSFASNSNDSFVSVDQDGIGATYSAEAVMKLNGFTTSDTLGDLIGNGTIITE